MRYISILLFGLLFSNNDKSPYREEKINTTVDVHVEKLVLNDNARQRTIPIAIYTNTAPNNAKKRLPVVIFSHGYGKNQGDTYLKYSYINNFLASKNYCAISVQHEVKTDDFLPMSGDLKVLRLPFWERGTKNIRFVIHSLSEKYPLFDFSNIILIGHSNGGDISCHYSNLFPDSVQAVITLDNLRKSLPKNKEISVLSIRASDTKADEGVIPSPTDQKKYGIKIVNLSNTKHSDMNDKASDEQKSEITREISSFLEKLP